jgi:hypothetical protein
MHFTTSRRCEAATAVPASRPRGATLSPAMSESECAETCAHAPDPPGACLGIRHFDRSQCPSPASKSAPANFRQGFAWEVTAVEELQHKYVLRSDSGLDNLKYCADLCAGKRTPRFRFFLVFQWRTPLVTWRLPSASGNGLRIIQSPSFCSRLSPVDAASVAVERQCSLHNIQEDQSGLHLLTTYTGDNQK